MAVAHLDCLTAKGQCKHLMTKANPENRKVGLGNHVFDHRHGINAGCRRIAGAIGQENPIGVMGHHIVKSGGCRQNGHIATRRGKAAQDVALGTVIDGNDLVFRVGLRGISLGPGPPHFVPAVGLRAGHVFGQIRTFQAGKPAGCCNQCFDVEIAFGIMGERGMGGPLLADGAGQAAGINTADRDAAPCRQPFGQRLDRTPAAGVGGHPFDNHAGGNRIAGFIVFGRGAGVADMGEGKGDDLPRIGRIGHDFLIAGHRRVETQLGHGLPCRAKSHPVKYRSVRKC